MIITCLAIPNFLIGLTSCEQILNLSALAQVMAIY